MNFKQLEELEEQQDVFWYPGMNSSPPVNFTPGVIVLLKQALQASYAGGRIKRAVLCDKGVVYVNHLIWDMSWGASYRLFTMACCALMASKQPYRSQYQAVLTKPSVPGVRNLQKWLEDAWNVGYDPKGRDALKNRLIGTSKKLSMQDLWTAFVSRKIPASFAFFDCGSKGEYVVSEVDEGVSEVDKGELTALSWIVQLFERNLSSSSSSSGIQSTSQMPFFMATQLTNTVSHYAVVGYEVDVNDNISLLVFDPTRKTVARGVSPTIRLTV
ncbi:hypothetical protein PQX77_006626 [Marasmius sp. AFHP31]|nr:hypothetical protein PQX77_006626 [Marasmius sp. AFHP31]